MVLTLLVFERGAEEGDDSAEQREAQDGEEVACDRVIAFQNNAPPKSFSLVASAIVFNDVATSTTSGIAGRIVTRVACIVGAMKALATAHIETSTVILSMMRARIVDDQYFNARSP